MKLLFSYYYLITSADILNLLLYTGRTVYESFKAKPVIATKSEADNRVESTVSGSHIFGDGTV